MQTLVIDAGNTHIKVAIYHDTTMKEFVHLAYNEVDQIKLYAKAVDYAIFSSVSVDAAKLSEQCDGIPAIVFTPSTPLPFQNRYQTPQTIGTDRLAAVAGAQSLFPHQPVLVIDCGTCITYDFMNAEGTYLGGAIAPGIHMRLKAMHEFTARLPMVSGHTTENYIGNTTEQCLISGAFFGVVHEISGTVARYEKDFDNLKTIICGGDALILEKQLKNNIFAAPNLVLDGLNQILHFNVKKGQ